ncbi:MAG: hypothetical protein M3256_14045 [Actinomycetota bacterium]|nr:hypothetical protein [Actinomycetota bacterium]
MSVVQGGGMVPVVITTVADTASLSSEDSDTLRARVEDAGLFALSVTPSDAMPGQPRYQITVEEDGRENQVVLNDTALPENVRSLISWIESVPGHEQHVGPPGGA